MSIDTTWHIEKCLAYFSWERLEYRMGHIVSVEGLGDVKVVDSNDTDEYSGKLYIVFEIDGKLYMKEGRYVSHDGTYWDGLFYEVTARTETVTNYYPKGNTDYV